MSYEENVWESMAGEAMAHRILKNAGCVPACDTSWRENLAATVAGVARPWQPEA